MKYDISIITYLDILGFKNIVKGTDTADEILTILKKFKYFSKPDKDLAKDYEQSFINFSDSSVRITKILSKVNRERPVGLLFYELLDVLHLQFELVNLGIFVRGGITIGDIYFKNKYIFGPGLIKAYELESNTAIFPRIIIPEEIIKSVMKVPALKNYQHSIDDELEEINKLVKYDKNGFYFIDYLKASESEIEPPDYINFLFNHKINIKKNLSLFKNDEKVLPKYKWLKKYHNSTISSMDESFFEIFSEIKNNFLV